MSQINHVENPIINSPFEEPQCFWHLERGRQPQKRDGRRRASYFFRVPERAARGRKQREQSDLFTEDLLGEEYPLDNANLVRQRLKDWQARGFEGTTKVTREPLDLWQSVDRRERLFFAQLEAALAVIFLVEATPDLLHGITVPLDEPGPEAKAKGYKAFLRYALKMATGSGKTTVMGMLAAWQILNKVANPQSVNYSDTVLLICPNVTIRDRLRELDPNLDTLSLYRTRELVPAHRMADLRRGEVFITNWHNLERRELSDVNGISARVVKRGVPITRRFTRTIEGQKVEVEETRYYESDAAYLKRLLRKRKGRSQAIFVMNDEAHHAYRRGDVGDEYAIDDETANRNAREATVWIEGLDRINKTLGGRGNGIRLCVDLSATPFYIQSSGNEVGRPFAWVISDFSLLEAIESGLVKIPQLPTQDTTGADTPPYFNIWRWIAERANIRETGQQMTPALVMKYATQPIVQLAEEWRKTHELWEAQASGGLRRRVPPVFIIVCRDTALARELYEWIAGNRPGYGAAPAWFHNAPGNELTVRVDSKVADEIESGSGADESRRLRFVLETIGRTEWPGGKVPEEYAAIVQKHNHRALEEDSELAFIDETVPPGRDVRCIISVAMLSEGWDATTVTHVVGLRPFGSQLLCEQVVGRSLRRTSYALDTDGRFREETAKVFGVPFELIPFKVEGGDTPPPTPPAYHVFAAPAKADLEITFPVVEGYHDPGWVSLSIDWARVPMLTVDPLRVPDQTLLQNLSGIDSKLLAFGPGQKALVSLDEWRKRMRVQQVAFAIAAGLVRDWTARNGEVIPTHRLFPIFVGYAERFLKEKIQRRGNSAPQDVGINPYFQEAVGALADHIKPVNRQGEETELPVIAPGREGQRSTANVDFYTGRALETAAKSHVNALVVDSRWEKAAAFCLDTHPGVRAWVKNDHLGFVVPYRIDGSARKYLPDFVIELNVDALTRWIVEIKGEERLDDPKKRSAAERWVRAVNRDGRFGRWEYL